MGTWHANFITYENKRNPHISIHKNGYNQIKKMVAQEKVNT